MLVVDVRFSIYYTELWHANSGKIRMNVLVEFHWVAKKIPALTKHELLKPMKYCKYLQCYIDRVYEMRRPLAITRRALNAGERKAWNYTNGNEIIEFTCT